MSALTAAVVLLGIVVVVLAFAMAGILGKVRELERRSAGLVPRQADAVAALAAVSPHSTHSLAAVLVVDEGCDVCAEVTPRFVQAASHAPGHIEFVVLCGSDSPELETANVRMLADPVVHSRLHPGWSPAVMIVADEHILAVEPAGSPEAVDAIVAQAVQWQRTT